MPFYEYVCKSCGKDFVLLQSMSAKEEETSCPYCDDRNCKKMLSSFSTSGHDHSVCGIGSHGGG